MRIHPLLRLTAFFVCFVFTFTTIAQASPDWYSRIAVANENGKIEEQWFSPDTNQKHVIILQDAHEYLDSQRNIAAILDSLTTDYQDDALVFVEGAVGEVQTANLANYPLREARQSASDALLKNGIITGVEHAALISDRPLELWGIEDPDLFDQDLKYFYSVSMEHSRVTTSFQKFRSALEQAKATTYSSAMLTFDQQVRSFNAERADILAYIEAVNANAEVLGIDLYEYPNITLLNEIVNLKTHIDQGALLKELRLIGGASQDGQNNLTYDYEGIASESDAFMSFLHEAGISVEASAKEFPSVAQQMNFLRKQALLSMSDLIDELHSISQIILCGMAPNEKARQLVELDNSIELAESFLCLRATRKEVQVLQQGHAKEMFLAIKEKLDAVTPDYGRDILVADLDDLSKLWNKAERFYEYAEKREQAMLDNTLQKMAEEGKDLGVVVVGGYHSTGLKQILKAENISYSVITPNVAMSEKYTGYMDRMLGNVLPLAPHLTSYINTHWVDYNSPTITALLSSLAQNDKAAFDFIDHEFSARWQTAVLSDPKLLARLAILADSTGDAAMRIKINQLLALAENVASKTDYEEFLKAENKHEVFDKVIAQNSSLKNALMKLFSGQSVALQETIQETVVEVSQDQSPASISDDAVKEKATVSVSKTLLLSLFLVLIPSIVLASVSSDVPFIGSMSSIVVWGSLSVVALLVQMVDMRDFMSFGANGVPRQSLDDGPVTLGDGFTLELWEREEEDLFVGMHSLDSTNNDSPKYEYTIPRYLLDPDINIYKVRHGEDWIGNIYTVQVEKELPNGTVEKVLLVDAIQIPWPHAQGISAPYEVVRDFPFHIRSAEKAKSIADRALNEIVRHAEQHGLHAVWLSGLVSNFEALIDLYWSELSFTSFGVDNEQIRKANGLEHLREVELDEYQYVCSLSSLDARYNLPPQMQFQLPPRVRARIDKFAEVWSVNANREAGANRSQKQRAHRAESFASMSEDERRVYNELFEAINAYFAQFGEEIGYMSAEAFRHNFRPVGDAEVPLPVARARIDAIYSARDKVLTVCNEMLRMMDGTDEVVKYDLNDVVDAARNAVTEKARMSLASVDESSLRRILGREYVQLFGLGIVKLVEHQMQQNAQTPRDSRDALLAVSSEVENRYPRLPRYLKWILSQDQSLLRDQTIVEALDRTSARMMQIPDFPGHVYGYSKESFFNSMHQNPEVASKLIQFFIMKHAASTGLSEADVAEWLNGLLRRNRPSETEVDERTVFLPHFALLGAPEREEVEVLVPEIVDEEEILDVEMTVVNDTTEQLPDAQRKRLLLDAPTGSIEAEERGLVSVGEVKTGEQNSENRKVQRALNIIRGKIERTDEKIREESANLSELRAGYEDAVNSTVAGDQIVAAALAKAIEGIEAKIEELEETVVKLNLVRTRLLEILNAAAKTENKKEQKSTLLGNVTRTLSVLLLAGCISLFTVLPGKAEIVPLDQVNSALSYEQVHEYPPLEVIKSVTAGKHKIYSPRADVALFELVEKNLDAINNNFLSEEKVAVANYLLFVYYGSVAEDEVEEYADRLHTIGKAIGVEYYYDKGIEFALRNWEKLWNPIIRAIQLERGQKSYSDKFDVVVADSFFWGMKGPWFLTQLGNEFADGWSQEIKVDVIRWLQRQLPSNFLYVREAVLNSMSKIVVTVDDKTVAKEVASILEKHLLDSSVIVRSTAFRAFVEVVPRVGPDYVDTAMDQLQEIKAGGHAKDIKSMAAIAVTRLRNMASEELEAARLRKREKEQQANLRLQQEALQAVKKRDAEITAQQQREEKERLEREAREKVRSVDVGQEQQADQLPGNQPISLEDKNDGTGLSKEEAVSSAGNVSYWQEAGIKLVYLFGLFFIPLQFAHALLGSLLDVSNPRYSKVKNAVIQSSFLLVNCAAALVGFGLYGMLFTPFGAWGNLDYMLSIFFSAPLAMVAELYAVHVRGYASDRLKMRMKTIKNDLLFMRGGIRYADRNRYESLPFWKTVKQLWNVKRKKFAPSAVWKNKAKEFYNPFDGSYCGVGWVGAIAVDVLVMWLTWSMHDGWWTFLAMAGTFFGGYGLIATIAWQYANKPGWAFWQGVRWVSYKIYNGFVAVKRFKDTLLSYSFVNNVHKLKDDALTDIDYERAQPLYSQMSSEHLGLILTQWLDNGESAKVKQLLETGSWNQQKVQEYKNFAAFKEHIQQAVRDYSAPPATVRAANLEDVVIARMSQLKALGVAQPLSQLNALLPVIKQFVSNQDSIAPVDKFQSFAELIQWVLDLSADGWKPKSQDFVNKFSEVIAPLYVSYCNLQIENEGNIEIKNAFNALRVRLERANIASAVVLKPIIPEIVTMSNGSAQVLELLRAVSRYSDDVWGKQQAIAKFHEETTGLDFVLERFIERFGSGSPQRAKMLRGFIVQLHEYIASLNVPKPGFFTRNLLLGIMGQSKVGRLDTEETTVFFDLQLIGLFAPEIFTSGVDSVMDGLKTIKTYQTMFRQYVSKYDIEGREFERLKAAWHSLNINIGLTYNNQEMPFWDASRFTYADIKNVRRYDVSLVAAVSRMVQLVGSRSNNARDFIFWIGTFSEINPALVHSLDKSFEKLLDLYFISSGDWKLFPEVLNVYYAKYGQAMPLVDRTLQIATNSELRLVEQRLDALRMYIANLRALEYGLPENYIEVDDAITFDAMISAIGGASVLKNQYGKRKSLQKAVKLMGEKGLYSHYEASQPHFYREFQEETARMVRGFNAPGEKFRINYKDVADNGANGLQQLLPPSDRNALFKVIIRELFAYSSKSALFSSQSGDSHKLVRLYETVQAENYSDGMFEGDDAIAGLNQLLEWPEFYDVWYQKWSSSDTTFEGDSVFTAAEFKAADKQPLLASKLNKLASKHSQALDLFTGEGDPIEWLNTYLKSDFALQLPFIMREYKGEVGLGQTDAYKKQISKKNEQIAQTVLREISVMTSSQLAEWGEHNIEKAQFVKKLFVKKIFAKYFAGASAATMTDSFCEQVNKMKDISKLVKQTNAFRTQTFKSLTSDQQNKITTLNRLLLENTYRSLCPPDDMLEEKILALFNADNLSNLLSEVKAMDIDLFDDRLASLVELVRCSHLGQSIKERSLLRLVQLVYFNSLQSVTDSVYQSKDRITRIENSIYYWQLLSEYLLKNGTLADDLNAKNRILSLILAKVTEGKEYFGAGQDGVLQFVLSGGTLADFFKGFVSGDCTKDASHHIDDTEGWTYDPGCFLFKIVEQGKWVGSLYAFIFRDEAGKIYFFQDMLQIQGHASVNNAARQTRVAKAYVAAMIEYLGGIGVDYFVMSNTGGQYGDTLKKTLQSEVANIAGSGSKTVRLKKVGGLGHLSYFGVPCNKEYAQNTGNITGTYQDIAGTYIEIDKEIYEGKVKQQKANDLIEEAKILAANEMYSDAISAYEKAIDVWPAYKAQVLQYIKDVDVLQHGRQVEDLLVIAKPLIDEACKDCTSLGDFNNQVATLLVEIQNEYEISESQLVGVEDYVQELRLAMLYDSYVLLDKKELDALLRYKQEVTEELAQVKAARDRTAEKGMKAAQERQEVLSQTLQAIHVELVEKVQNLEAELQKTKESINYVVQRIAEKEETFQNGKNEGVIPIFSRMAKGANRTAAVFAVLFGSLMVARNAHAAGGLLSVVSDNLFFFLVGGAIGFCLGVVVSYLYRSMFDDSDGYYVSSNRSYGRPTQQESRMQWAMPVLPSIPRELTRKFKLLLDQSSERYSALKPKRRELDVPHHGAIKFDQAIKAITLLFDTLLEHESISKFFEGKLFYRTFKEQAIELGLTADFDDASFYGHFRARVKKGSSVDVSDEFAEKLRNTLLDIRGRAQDRHLQNHMVERQIETSLSRLKEVVKLRGLSQRVVEEYYELLFMKAYFEFQFKFSDVDSLVQQGRFTEVLSIVYELFDIRLGSELIALVENKKLQEALNDVLADDLRSVQKLVDEFKSFEKSDEQQDKKEQAVVDYKITMSDRSAVDILRGSASGDCTAIHGGAFYNTIPQFMFDPGFLVFKLFQDEEWVGNIYTVVAKHQDKPVLIIDAVQLPSWNREWKAPVTKLADSFVEKVTQYAKQAGFQAVVMSSFVSNFVTMKQHFEKKYELMPIEIEKVGGFDHLKELGLWDEHAQRNEYIESFSPQWNRKPGLVLDVKPNKVKQVLLLRKIWSAEENTLTKADVKTRDLTMQSGQFLKPAAGTTHYGAAVLLFVLAGVASVPSSLHAATYALRGPPADKAQSVVATIQKGDTLWDIAGRAYQPTEIDPNQPYQAHLQYKHIIDANQALLVGRVFYDSQGREIAIVQPGEEYLIPGEVNHKALGLTEQAVKTAKVSLLAAPANDNKGEVLAQVSELESEVADIKADQRALVADINTIKAQEAELIEQAATIEQRLEQSEQMLQESNQAMKQPILAVWQKMSFAIKGLLIFSGLGVVLLLGFLGYRYFQSKKIKAEVSSLKKQLDAVRAEVDVLKDRLHQKTAESDTKVVDVAPNNIDYAQATVSELQILITALQAEKKQLEESVAMLKQQKRELVAQKSDIDFAAGKVDELVDKARKTLLETSSLFLSEEAKVKGLDRFLKLVRIPSPSYNENVARDYIERILCDMGGVTVLKENQDDASSEPRNLIVEFPATGKFIGEPGIVLNAHMDTVQSSNDRIGFNEQANELFHLNNGSFGADDKAGVSIILEALRYINETRWQQGEDHRKITVIITAQEEAGYAGARHLSSAYPQVFDNVLFTLTADGPIDLRVPENKGGNFVAVLPDDQKTKEPYASLLATISRSASDKGRTMLTTQLGLGVGDFAFFPDEAKSALHLRAPYKGNHHNERVSIKDWVDHIDLWTEIIGKHAHATQEQVAQKGKTAFRAVRNLVIAFLLMAAIAIPQFAKAATFEMIDGGKQAIATVVKGDTLWSIAGEAYKVMGSKSKFASHAQYERILTEANNAKKLKGKIKRNSADDVIVTIQPGDKLIIPAVDDAPRVTIDQSIFKQPVQSKPGAGLQTDKGADADHLRALQQAKGEVQAELNLLKQNVTEAQAELQRLQQEIAGSQSQQQTLLATVQSLQDQKLTLTGEVESLALKISQAKEELQQVQSAHERAVEQVGEMQTATRQEVAQLEEAQRTLESAIAKLEKSKAGLEQAIKELEQTKTRVTDELSGLQSQYDELQQKIATAKGKLPVEGIGKGDDAALTELSTKLAALRTSLSELQGKEQKGLASVARLESDIKGLEGQVADLQKERDALNTAIGEAQKQNQTIKEQVASASKELKQLSASLEEKQREIQQAGEEYVSLQQSITELDQKKVQLTTQLDQLKAEIAEQQSRLQQLKTNLSNISLKELLSRGWWYLLAGGVALLAVIAAIGYGVRRKITKLKKEIDKLNEKANRRRNKIDEIENEITAAANERDEVREELAQVNGELEDARTEIDAIAQAKSDNENERLQLDNLEQNVTERETAIAEQQTALSEQEKQLAELQMQIEEKQKQLTQKAEDLAEREKAIATREAEIEDENSKLSERQQRISDKETAVVEKEKEIRSREEEHVQAQVALEQEKLDLEEKQSTLDQEKAKFDEQAEERDRIVEELEVKRAELEQLDKLLQEQLTEVKVQVQAKRDEVHADKEKLEQEHEEIAGQLQKLEEQRGEIRTALEEEQNQLEQVQKSLSQVEEQLAGMQGEKEELDKTKGNLAKEIDGYKAEKAELSSKAAQLRADLEKLEEETTLRKAELTEAMATLENDKTVAEQALQEQERLLSEKEDEVVRVSEEMEGLREQFEQVSAQFDSKEASFKEMQEKCEQEKEVLRSLREKRKETKESLDSLNNSLAQIGLATKEASEQRNQALNALSEVEDELKAKQEESDSLSEKLALLREEVSKIEKQEESIREKLSADSLSGHYDTKGKVDARAKSQRPEISAKAAHDLLIGLSTVGNYKSGIGNDKNIIDALEDQLSQMGYSFERQVFGTGSQQGCNLIVDVQPTAGCFSLQRLVFNAHIDIVKGHKFSIVNSLNNEDKKKYEGSVDDRSGVVALMLMLNQLKTASIEHGPMTVIFTDLEERGAIGAKYLTGSHKIREISDSSAAFIVVDGPLVWKDDVDLQKASGGMVRWTDACENPFVIAKEFSGENGAEFQKVKSIITSSVVGVMPEYDMPRFADADGPGDAWAFRDSSDVECPVINLRAPYQDISIANGLATAHWHSSNEYTHVEKHLIPFTRWITNIVRDFAVTENQKHKSKRKTSSILKKKLNNDAPIVLWQYDCKDGIIAEPSSKSGVLTQIALKQLENVFVQLRKDYGDEVNLVKKITVLAGNDRLAHVDVSAGEIGLDIDAFANEDLLLMEVEHELLHLVLDLGIKKLGYSDYALFQELFALFLEFERFCGFSSEEQKAILDVLRLSSDIDDKEIGALLASARYLTGQEQLNDIVQFLNNMVDKSHNIPTFFELNALLNEVHLSGEMERRIEKAFSEILKNHIVRNYRQTGASRGTSLARTLWTCFYSLSFQSTDNYNLRTSFFSEILGVFGYESEIHFIKELVDQGRDFSYGSAVNMPIVLSAILYGMYGLDWIDNIGIKQYLAFDGSIDSFGEESGEELRWKLLCHVFFHKLPLSEQLVFMKRYSSVLTDDMFFEIINGRDASVEDYKQYLISLDGRVDLQLSNVREELLLLVDRVLKSKAGVNASTAKGKTNFTREEHEVVNGVIRVARESGNGYLVAGDASGWKDVREEYADSIQEVIHGIRNYAEVDVPNIGRVNIQEVLNRSNVVLIKAQQGAPKGLVVNNRGSYQVAHSGLTHSTMYFDRDLFDDFSLMERALLLAHEAIELESKRLASLRGMAWTPSLARRVHEVAQRYEEQIVGRSNNGSGTRFDDAIEQEIDFNLVSVTDVPAVEEVQPREDSHVVGQDQVEDQEPEKKKGLFGGGLGKLFKRKEKSPGTTAPDVTVTNIDVQGETGHSSLRSDQVSVSTPDVVQSNLPARTAAQIAAERVKAKKTRGEDAVQSNHEPRNRDDVIRAGSRSGSTMMDDMPRWEKETTREKKRGKVVFKEPEDQSSKERKKSLRDLFMGGINKATSANLPAVVTNTPPSVYQFPPELRDQLVSAHSSGKVRGLPLDADMKAALTRFFSFVMPNHTDSLISYLQTANIYIIDNDRSTFGATLDGDVIYIQRSCIQDIIKRSISVEQVYDAIDARDADVIIALFRIMVHELGAGFFKLSHKANEELEKLFLGALNREQYELPGWAKNEIDKINRTPDLNAVPRSDWATKKYKGDSQYANVDVVMEWNIFEEMLDAPRPVSDLLDLKGAIHFEDSITLNHAQKQYLENFLKDMISENYGLFYEFVAKKGEFLVVSTDVVDAVEDAKVRIPVSRIVAAYGGDITAERLLKEKIVLYGMWVESKVVNNVINSAMVEFMDGLRVYQATGVKRAEIASKVDELLTQVDRKYLRVFMREIFWEWHGVNQRILEDHTLQEKLRELYSIPVLSGNEHVGIVAFVHALHQLPQSKDAVVNTISQLMVESCELDAYGVWKESLARPFYRFKRLMDSLSFGDILEDDVYEAMDEVVFDNGMARSEMFNVSIGLVKQAEQGLVVKVHVDDALKKSNHYSEYIEKLFEVERAQGIIVDTEVSVEEADLVLVFEGQAFSDAPNVFAFSEDPNEFLREVVFFEHFFRWLLVHSPKNNGRLVIDLERCSQWVEKGVQGFALKKVLLEALSERIQTALRSRVIQTAA